MGFQILLLILLGVLLFIFIVIEGNKIINDE